MVALSQLHPGDVCIIHPSSTWKLSLWTDPNDTKTYFGQLTKDDDEFVILSFSRDPKVYPLLEQISTKSNPYFVQIITPSTLKFGWTVVDYDRDYGWTKVL